MAARPILTLVILCGAVTAHASPRTDPTVGRAVFTGATLPHATSINLNPAALGLGETPTEVYVAAATVLDYYAIDRRQLDPSGTLVDGERVRDAEVGVGGMLAVILRPGTGSRYAVSFELRTPPPELSPSNHDSLRYHTLGDRQRDLLASIASTIRITDRLYFGATLTHHNTFLRLRYARDAAAANGDGVNGISSDCDGAPCGFENSAATELYDVTVASRYVAASNLKATIGLLVRLYREIWLGVAYHTPPGFNIQSELEGNVEVIRAPRDGGATVRGESVVDVSYPASVDAEVRARLPQSLDLHVGGRWEDLSRMQAYDVRIAGSTIVPNNLPEWMLRTRGMHDAFALWGGVEQVDLGQRFRFGGRIGFETSAVNANRTTPTTIAPSSVTLDLGVQLRVGSWIAQLSYGLQYWKPVSVSDSDFDPRYMNDCIASGYNYALRACAAARDGYAIATGAGDYARILNSLRLGFRYELP